MYSTSPQTHRLRLIKTGRNNQSLQKEGEIGRMLRGVSTRVERERKRDETLGHK